MEAELVAELQERGGVVSAVAAAVSVLALHRFALLNLY